MPPQSSQQITLERILKFVAENKASDLHLSVGNPPVLRVDRRLLTLADEPLITPAFMENLVDSLLDKESKDILEKEKEVIVAKNLEGNLRFKIHIFYQKDYLSASLRFIPGSLKTFRELGLSEGVDKIIQQKKGLVVVSGTFGSGRSTTAASLLETINRERSDYIITLEKPIEYIFTNNKSIIEQREIGRDAISFEKALEAVAKEDADVVFVSEIEEPKVIDRALEGAASGHLVITVMDAPTTVATVEKIVGTFPQDEKERIRGELSENLAGVICERLLPRVGGGQILAVEILIPNEATRLAIREGAWPQINNILQTSREEGMVSLDRALADLVIKGEVLIEDALREAQDVNSFKMMVRG